MAAQFTYNKKERLKSRKLIGQLFKSGKGIHVFPVKVIYEFIEGEAPLQAGVVANKRNFKRSVDRNLIKRLMREGYRLEKPALQQVLTDKGLSLMLFFIYTGKELPTYFTVKEVMKKLVSQLVDVVERRSV